MPYVKSHYRRSKGMAAADDAQRGRNMHVAVYDAATGTDLLKARSGVRVTNLRYSTGIPGGFLECRFSVSCPRLTPIDTGQKVIVRRGLDIVWWGWVEDVERSQQGRLDAINVVCLGPWQNCEQRLVEAWGGGLETADAVKVLLLQYCERISADYSHIDATGITADPDQEQNFVTVSSLIQEVCEIGNSSDQPMLFAIWAPNETRLSALTATNLAPNGNFETGTGADATGWTEITGVERLAHKTHGGSYAMHSTAAAGTCTSADFISVAAGKNYCLSLFYCYYIADGDDAGVAYLYTVKVNWYDSSDVLLSTTTYTYVTDFPAATTNWQQLLKWMTAPASAAKAKIEIGVRGGDTETRTVYGVVDDVTLYAENESGGTEAKPIAWLWARDLSDYDYMVYTARLEAPWALNETTRQLTNAVWASYQGTYTAEAQDSASQTAYRRRDAVVDAGELDATSAAQYRDTYLARWQEPTEEPASLDAGRLTVLNKRGRPVDATVLRAGNRIKIMDGVRAGTTIMISSTEYGNGVVSLTPDKEAAVVNLLARTI